MVKDIFHSIAAAARRLFVNWVVLLISLSMYLALLGAIYLFFNIREATVAQVTLNLILPIAAVALFFLIQAMGLSYVRIGVDAAYLLKRSLGDCWRILLASLPVILIAWLIIYLFGKADQSFFIESGAAGSKAMKWGWGAVAVHGIQIFLIHVFLPLVTIHLWIATVREGLAAAFKGVGRVVRRALAPRSLLVYVALCAVFGATVYFLLVPYVDFKGPWTQLWAVGIKTALALLLTFIGWLLTLGSIAELTTRREMKEFET
ncbi:MAG TPA: hypothetical protein VE715_04140 [Blastocatellia bacterium]|nr:hypothetical protein [Blastocatellia bacterium]